MNNCCCAELVVDEGQQIELNVESDGGIEVGVAEQFVIGAGGNYQSKTVNITPTESAQSQTVRADVGYDALDEVEVNVAAIADDYVGSAVPRKSSANVAINGAKFTAPAGYYASDAEKTMTTAAWSASATKGAVSNHSVSVTPTASIDVAGYRPVGTKNGTAVSVSASELVSGTLSITSSGTKDVTNYASASVSAGTEGTPTATKGTVSNHSVSVTPSVTNTAGYISGGTKTGTAVSVSASELVSGTKSITANGTGIDVTEYAAVDVAVPSGSPTLQNKTVYPSSSDQSITADVGYDGLGTVTAKAVTTTNLTAANIVSGVTVEVGDADDSDRIASVTGTASTGVQYGPTDYPILIKNARSGTIAVARVTYDSTTTLGAINANISSGATSTYSDMVTDGTHIWFRSNQGSTVKYNGNTATYSRSSQYFMVTIPAGYNGTIPFEVS